MRKCKPNIRCWHRLHPHLGYNQRCTHLAKNNQFMPNGTSTVVVYEANLPWCNKDLALSMSPFSCAHSFIASVYKAPCLSASLSKAWSCTLWVISRS